MAIHFFIKKLQRNLREIILQECRLYNRSREVVVQKIIEEKNGQGSSFIVQIIVDYYWGEQQVKHGTDYATVLFNLEKQPVQTTIIFSRTTRNVDSNGVKVIWKQKGRCSPYADQFLAKASCYRLRKSHQEKLFNYFNGNNK